ncbi:hypothetical protein JYU34_014627 [Plutella xylostella]|uniref:Chemosensory protein n=1 Tax=Plutella xylostella TaxID=51655 RepID=A0ABQ7Q9V1_PLUXY|nr:hypothetical protein JYU34_014627 [Plutella xylostella]
MRAVFVLCACVWGAVGQDINSMRTMPKYDSRYDYLDVDAILDSKRLVRNYVDCLIAIKPCTPEGKALKRILPEALRTKCIRCTDRQKRTAVKVIKRLKYEYPSEWAKLSCRWDPSGDFTRFFEEFLAKEAFNTISGTGNELPGTLTSQATPAPPPPPPPVPALSARFPEVMDTEPPTATPRVDFSTPPRPAILNRFGDDGELMLGSPSSVPQRPSMRPDPTATARPMQTRATQTTWSSSASDAVPTRFPLRNDIPPPYSTAITFIDQIGYKIIRTTELVTDILKNTVRAVVGR